MSIKVTIYGLNGLVSTDSDETGLCEIHRNDEWREVARFMSEMNERDRDRFFHDFIALWLDENYR